MEDKKKRGSNYTLAEKDILLDLVKKYQHIVENKETNATMIVKKREAWAAISKQYNAVAVSGSRDWQQLRHLYENIKQRSKKSIAKANHYQFYEKTSNLKDVQTKASVDKKEINRTGGGSYHSTLSDHDAQILAMVAPQIKPLSNPYDDAALYFGDSENIDAQATLEIIVPDAGYVAIEDKNLSNNIIETETRAPCTVTSCSAGDQEVTTPVSNINLYQKVSTSTYKPTGKKQVNKSNTKEQYFNMKLRNAKLERKFLIQKNRMEINKYKMEMQILSLKLKKLQYRKK